MSLKHLHIAVGIIRNDEGEIFITQRGGDSHLSGLWEFPGGKIEVNESPVQGLQRELLEETGIEVLDSEFAVPAGSSF
ncbi:8-oxo-dGTP diphosphatase [Hafnia alvei]|uniref:8-oxo-dGTP diphosphatase n=1 Tax=Hafnia alvei TaxID=569 RepID=A0A377PNW3_HAFAL|nr:8-oxo-dGTP diphosphatase [Hafnia alvei]